MLWTPKLIQPNPEQDVASVFTEARLSAGNNGAFLRRQRTPHITSSFFKNLQSCHFVSQKISLVLSLSVNYFIIFYYNVIVLSMLHKSKKFSLARKAVHCFENVIIPISQKSNYVFIFEIENDDIKEKM